MVPENLRFGGGVSQTVLNPVVAIIVLIAGILICCLPRDKVIIPFLAACILIPNDQVLLLGGLHFPMQRILILFGLVRIFRSPGKTLNGGINKIDIVVILMTLAIAVNAVLLWQESAALTNQLGEMYTVFGTYFFLRFLIRGQEDIGRAIRVFAGITAFVAVVMLYEQAKGWNPYALLGGARASFFSSILERDGRFRAMGCFAQPILAGTFGAVLVPLFVGLWWTDKKHRGTAMVGIIAATVMILASNSSTPITGYLAGFLALSMWPLRKQMRLIRWGIALTLISLHMVMKAPVWHLISRVDLSGGSSSYHRYELINQCIRHFWDWWLVGTKSNADWGFDMWDTANQYVGTAEAAGLVPLLLLLAIIVYGFKYVGRARRVAASRRQALFMWALGSALFAHVVSFFGISYFDQTIVAWYALLAMISAAAAIPRKKEAGLPRLNSERELTASDPWLVPQAACITNPRDLRSLLPWPASGGSLIS